MIHEMIFKINDTKGGRTMNVRFHDNLHKGK